jgi:hypothetical protein
VARQGTPAALSPLASADDDEAKGLKLSAGLRFEAWVAMGRRVARVSNVSAWWLGDWLVFGQHAYPQRYRSALDVTALDYQTLRNYAWVAGRVEASRRRDTLSFQHHAEVAALAPAEQDLWLARAEAGGWSRNELRRRLAAHRQGRPAVGEQVCVRIQVPVAREQRWRAAAAAAGVGLADWITSTADAAATAQLSPGTPWSGRLEPVETALPAAAAGEPAAVGLT